MHVRTHTSVCLCVHKIKPTRNGFYVIIYIEEWHLRKLMEVRKLPLGLLKFSSNTSCFLSRMFLEGGWEREESILIRNLTYFPWILFFCGAVVMKGTVLLWKPMAFGFGWLRKTGKQLCFGLYKLQLTYNAVRGFSHKSISICELILIWYCQMSC